MRQLIFGCVLLLASVVLAQVPATTAVIPDTTRQYIEILAIDFENGGPPITVATGELIRMGRRWLDEHSYARLLRYEVACAGYNRGGVLLLTIHYTVDPAAAGPIPATEPRQ